MLVLFVGIQNVFSVSFEPRTKNQEPRAKSQDKPPDMIRNYLKIAFRNLWKNKTFSTVNILGLSIGMVAVMLIMQYVDFELSYDEWHVRGDRIYRVAMDMKEANGERQTFAFTYPAVAPAMREELPEVESAVRFRRTNAVLSHEAEMHNEQIYFADSTLLDIFSFPILKGDAEQALSEPYQAMISATAARKYFGPEEAIGKTLQDDNGFRYEVKAVFEDIPENSHIRFDIAISYITYVQVMAQYGNDAENNWNWSDFYTYVLLEEDAAAERLRDKLPAFAKRHKGADMDKHNYELNFYLQPLKDIHLNSDLGYELSVNGNARYVYFLVLIAVFIVLIAWFNYINLSTARSIDRAREVGVRKVVGASRGQLVGQFLLESAMVNLLALAIAFLAVDAVFPAFRDLVGKDIELTLFGAWSFWLLVAAIFFGGTLLAGLYPAFVLSRFRPVSVLKSSLESSISQGGGLRRVLVALQFVATIALVAGTFVVYRQLQFMRQQDLGVNIEQTLVLQDMFSRDSTYREAIRGFKQELTQHPGITTVSSSGDIFGKEVGNSTGVRWVRSESESMRRVRTFGIDQQFISQFDLNIIAGRGFREGQRPEDENEIILNETALKILGLPGPEAAIGEEIESSYFRGRVVGVLEDYHQEALKYDFKPIVFYEATTPHNYYSLKVKTDDIQGLIAFAQDKWKARFASTPFQYFFLDEYFNRQYLADRRFGQIFSVFTSLAILVAALGLFGLSSFSVARRRKEIGIRKVLGAEVGQILLLLSKEYVRLVLVAGVLALPAAYFLMRRWLDNYAYHIELGWWFFFIPLLAVLLIAALTVSYQSIRAAMANPVKALRQE